MSTKAEIIARYGNEYYDACQARARARAKEKYHASPREMRVPKVQSTEEKRKKHAAYMNKWYHKNSEKVIQSQTASLSKKKDSMTDEERVAFMALKASRSKSSRMKKLEEYRLKALQYQKERWASLSPEDRTRIMSDNWRSKKAKLKEDPEAEKAWREKTYARHAAWREANREHINELGRKRLERPEIKAYYRIQSIVGGHRRRAAGPIDRDYVKWIRSQSCIDCGSTEKIEVGHIVPVCEGGMNENSNLIPQCRSCNRRLSRKPHRLAKADV